MASPKQTVDRIRTMLAHLDRTGRRDMQVVLTPYHYEHLLIVKGLPHGLGVLNQFGPYLERIPIKTFGPYPVKFVMTGKSHVAAVSVLGQPECWGVSDGKIYVESR